MKTQASMEQTERAAEEARLRELTLESLGSAGAELRAMADRIVEQIPNIEMQNPTQGARDLMALVEPVSDFFQFWKSIEILFSIDYTTLMLPDGQSVEAFSQHMAGALEDLMKAFEARDTVRVNDLLEYEVAQGLRTYADVIPALTDIVRNKKVA